MIAWHVKRRLPHSSRAVHFSGMTMNLRSEMLLDAKWIMRDGLLSSNPAVIVDEKGYVTDWRSNLLPMINPALVEPDFRSGKGNELDRKFLAAHSSAALAVNVFGPFRDGLTSFPLPGVGEVKLEQFERKYPTGVSGRVPPHLDASARGVQGPVAIESKCLEYFTPKVASFSPEYQQLRQFEATPWYSEMERLRAAPRDYKALDVAQLIKHAFGLMNSAGEGATLLYAFWEPEDADRHDLFCRHREELALLKARTRDGRLRFTTISYPELWENWRSSGSALLREHAIRLQTRYSGKLGSYEAYTRVNGRKTYQSFFDLD